MSSATPSDVTARSDRQIDPLSVVEYPVRLLAFWSAVLLPFLILSLIGLGVAQQSPQLLTGLVTANVAGLVLGHDYKR